MAIRCSECVQLAFLSLAVVTTVAGLTLLAVGVTALTKDDWQLMALLGTALYPAVGAVLAAVGTLVAALGVLAVCGARLEDRRLLTVFFWVTLLLLVACGVAMVVAFAVGAQTALEDIRGQMLASIKRYQSDPQTRRQWDALQSESQCCGVDSAMDWTPVLGVNQVPSSCCLLAPPLEHECTATRGSYNAGCLRTVTASTETFTAVTGGVSAAVAVILLLAMVTSYVIASNSEHNHQYSIIGCPGGST